MFNIVLPRGDSADFTHADFCNQTFKTAPRCRTGSALAEIFVDDFDIGPASLFESLSHRILKSLTLGVVDDLVGRRLADVENRFTRHVLRFYFITHRSTPFDLRQ